MIAGAPAEIAGNCFTDLPVGRCRVLFEQGLGGQQEPRGTETALQPVVLAEGLLDGMEPLAVGQAFDGRQHRAVELDREEQAASHRLAVEQHRAGAAHAGLAAVRAASSISAVVGAQPASAASTAASVGVAPQPNTATRARATFPSLSVTSAAAPTSAKSPWRRATSCSPHPVPGVGTGQRVSTSSSSAASAVMSGPRKNSAAAMLRSPRRPRVTTTPS